MESGTALSIYVSSYDGCSDLWDTFFGMFNLFWGDCAYPAYLVTNELFYDREGVTVLQTGPEINWFNRTIKSLSEVKTEYVLFMLEDYLLSKYVSNADIEEIIEYMQLHDAFYYQLSHGKSQDVTRSDYGKRVRVLADVKYPISLQPAIWNRAELISVLKLIHGETPWDVENYYVVKYRELQGPIEGAWLDVRNLLGYKNGVLRGKWIPETLRYYKSLGVHIDKGERPAMNLNEEMHYRAAVFAHAHLPEGAKEPIKHVLDVLNIKHL